MIGEVKTERVTLEEYNKFISPVLLEEIKKIAEELKGLDVYHLNATKAGGGVAEILSSLVPLMQAAGLNTKWYVVPAKKKFSRVLLTKKLHLALQGGERPLSKEEREIYKKESKVLAKEITKLRPDIWIMHDLQPLLAGAFLKERQDGSFVSRFHIDLSSPDKSTWKFLLPYVLEYEKAIFTTKDFVPPLFPAKEKAIIPPAIDPLPEKNRLMGKERARKILGKYGIKEKDPLVVAVSRFDYLKDPCGMIDVYRMVKKKFPCLQFIFAGLMIADDDPEAKEVYKKTLKYAGKDKDIFLFADQDKIKEDTDTFIRALQTAADVFLHKSLFEGFGLSVTEAMLKKKAVVAGNVGGIRLQIEDGKNGFLVNSSKEAAKRTIELLENPGLAKKMGEAAGERVREKFLMPRLLRDYLQLIKNIRE